MKFVAREAFPRDIEIFDRTYPAIYSYKAISIMEEYTELPRMFTEARLLNHEEPVITSREFIGLILGVLTAGGVEVTAEELEESLMPQDEALLIPQLQKIVRDQTEKREEKEKQADKTKNGKAPQA